MATNSTKTALIKISGPSCCSESDYFPSLTFYYITNIMTFILKKKRYKFQVELCLEELSEVSYSKAILFAKVRQLEGGSFTDVSKRYLY